MTVLVACDLDRTLIYSARASGVAQTDLPSLVCVEIYEDAPLSYMTPKALDLLRDLAEVAVVVPTTTRTEAQLARVVLPGVSTRFAIAANGGALLVDGRADPVWRARVDEAVSAAGATVAEVGSYLGELAAADGWLLRLRDADGLFVYAVVDRDRVPLTAVTDLTRWCADRGWTVSLQGRKLYAVPDGITKSAAVAEVARRAGASRVLAAGDSVLDGPMLESAHAAIRPAHGELHGLGWTRPHVQVTGASGASAGEEIVAWLLATATGA